MLTTMLLLAALPDGGLPPTFSDTIYSSCPEAPPTVKLDGGWQLVPPERDQRIACLMDTCDTDRMLRKERAKAEANVPPWWWAIGVGGLAVGATLGVVVTLLAVPR